MPRGGSSLCGGFEGSPCGLGVLWVLVLCWGFTVGAIVGGWGLRWICWSHYPLTGVPFDWSLLSGDGGLVGFWISLGPLPCMHGFSCGGALTRGYYLLALFPFTLFSLGWPFGHFAGGASSLLGVGLFGLFRYI